MSNKFLYPCFNNWKGSIWFIADTHFNDADIKKYRNITDDELVKRINTRVSKNDTLVLLGDVGDLSYVQKLKAGYKVLIMGNHDSGISKYKRIKTKIADSYYLCNVCGNEVYPDFRDFYNCGYDEAYCSHCETTQQITYYDDKYEDNKLFDEVYEGQLTIRKNIVLSHEPVNFPFALNIHGHDHNGTDFKNYVLINYDADMDSQDMTKNYLEVIKANKLTKFNVCAEWIGSMPVSLKTILQSGILKNIDDIHRLAIDKAKEHK